MENLKCVIVDEGSDAGENNQKYGDEYGIDWKYPDSTEEPVVVATEEGTPEPVVDIFDKNGNPTVEETEKQYVKTHCNLFYKQAIALVSATGKIKREHEPLFYNTEAVNDNADYYNDWCVFELK